MQRSTKHIERFLGCDVVQAARERITWCYNSYDLPMVSFSGGKDSLAVLLLAVEVCGPLGIKPHVYFMDEEFVPSRTLEFVKYVFHDSAVSESIIPHWFCLQMESEVYCAGNSKTVVQWGTDRKEWMREPPEGALMDRERLYDVFSPDAALVNLFPGKSIVSMLGVRAAESLVRLTSVRYSANAKHPCFIRNSPFPQVQRAVPVYDWQTNDVLKFLSERQMINPLYYEMLCVGKTLRTDTPLHGRRCNVAAFKKLDPPFFDRLVTMFPEVHAGALYNSELLSDRELTDKAGDKYGRSWEGCAEYVKTEITDPAQRARAFGILKKAIRHICLPGRGDWKASRFAVYSKSW